MIECKLSNKELIPELARVEYIMGWSEGYDCCCDLIGIIGTNLDGKYDAGELGMLLRDLKKHIDKSHMIEEA